MASPLRHLLASLPLRTASLAPKTTIICTNPYTSTSLLRNSFRLFTSSSTSPLASSLSTVGAALSYLPKNHPWKFGLIFSLFKTSFADLLAQCFLEKRETIDWKRNATFATFGCFYLGGVQYFLYVPVFTRLFPHTKKFSELPWRQKFQDMKGCAGAAAQVFLDQFVHHPLMYFPVFYTVKELVTKEKPDVYNAVVNEYFGTNIVEDVKALWKIWLPTTCISFFFLPLWMRIPWSASTSALWTVILSFMRGGSSDPVLDPGEGMAVSGATGALLFEADWDDTHIDPVDSQPGLHHTTLTISGLDRKGMIRAISESIADAGGNVTVSKMNRLGSQMIMMMTISFDPQKVGRRQLESAVRKAAAGGFGGQSTKVNFTNLQHRSTNRRRSQYVTGVKLKITGEDQPGMIADASALLSTIGCNIERLDSYRKNKGSSANFHLHVDAGADREFTHAEIEHIKEETRRMKQKYNLTRAEVGILRHKRVELGSN